jgi:hypothetical protein
MRSYILLALAFVMALVQALPVARMSTAHSLVGESDADRGSFLG